MRLDKPSVRVGGIDKLSERVGRIGQTFSEGVWEGLVKLLDGAQGIG